MVPTDVQLNEFVDHYLAAALWAETQDGVPLDENYSIRDFNPESRSKAFSDSKDFFVQIPEGAVVEILEGEFREDGDCTSIAMAGHDFWLTRRGHGAGFWDGDWFYGKEMTRVCNAMKPIEIEASGEKVFLR